MLNNIFFKGLILLTVCVGLAYLLEPSFYTSPGLVDAKFGSLLSAMFTGLTLSLLFSKQYLKYGYFTVVIHLAATVISWYFSGNEGSTDFQWGLAETHLYFGLFLVIPALIISNFIYKKESEAVFKSKLLNRKVVYSLLFFLILLVVFYFNTWR